MQAHFSKDKSQEILAPPPGTAVVLPRELTPLIADGAIMEPLFVNQDWTRAKLHGPCAGINLPSKEDCLASLWMDQVIMDGAREHLSYECHDLRIVKIDDAGRLCLVTCRRVEQVSEDNCLETAPINGFWWSVGGRREIPRTGSPLDGKFGLIESVLNKARSEAGIYPENVLSIYDLGIGRTEFPVNMRYISKAMDAEGNLQESSREVRLAAPQRTINRNLVLVVNCDVKSADGTVEQLTFLTEDQYTDPQIRAMFCEYERKFMDAVFGGWNAAKRQSLI